MSIKTKFETETRVLIRNTIKSAERDHRHQGTCLRFRSDEIERMRVMFTTGVPVPDIMSEMRTGERTVYRYAARFNWVRRKAKARSR